MPTFLVIGAAAAALAVAGCGGGGGGGSSSAASSAPASSGSTGATGATGSTGSTGSTSSGGGAAATLDLSADPGGNLAFDKKTLSAKAGTVTLKMANPSQLPHGIAVEGNGVDKDGKVVQNGGTSEVTVDLKPGTYTFYCPVPGHKQGGMKGTLTVQ